MADRKETCPAVVFSTEFPDYHWPMRGIRVVRSGCGVLENHGRISLLRPGAVMRIEPGEKPLFHFLTPVSFLDFYLNDETADLLRNGTPVFSKEHDLRILPEAALRQASELADECLEIQRQKRHGYVLAVLEKFLAVERLLLENGELPGNMESKIAETVLFMEENYSRDITLRDLAGLIGVSISYFRRSFQRILGAAPIDFLLDLRLKHAAELLSETGSSIAEIASETGFSDPNYFSRLFSRRKGKSPRQWRQSLRKNPD